MVNTAIHNFLGQFSERGNPEKTEQFIDMFP